MEVADLRPCFTDSTAQKTSPGLRLTAVYRSPGVALDTDTRDILRDGLGLFDMEIRWLAHLDDSDVLRLWRSWTGHQIYEALVEKQAADRWVINSLKVEQDSDRYGGSVADEPDQFERILVSVVNTLRGFRCGHTPYGPSPDAEPLPPPWP
jgi:hypothetical protein